MTDVSEVRTASLTIMASLCYFVVCKLKEYNEMQKDVVIRIPLSRRFSTFPVVV
jgi:hypothetical protein